MPVLSHFTLNLPMQKARFTFIMPTKCIPSIMAMTFHDNSSKIFCKVMPKTDPSIKWSLDLGKALYAYRAYQLLQNNLQFRKYPKSYFQNTPRIRIFLSRCLGRVGWPWAWPMPPWHTRTTLLIAVPPPGVPRPRASRKTWLLKPFY